MKKIIKTLFKFLLIPLFFIYKCFHHPYVIIMVDGGLASQILKYGLGTSFQINSAKVFYDLSWFRDFGTDIKGNKNREFLLDKVFPAVSVKEPSRICLFLTKLFASHKLKYSHFYDESILSLKYVYLDGYFSNVRYLERGTKTLISSLKFSSEIQKNCITEADFIQSRTNPVAVHIRLGDYLGSIHQVVNLDYFKKAIKIVLESVESPFLLFFCTDKDYLQKEVLPQLPENLQYSIICNDDTAGYYDMYKMSLCKHFIISNSGFSFFPAWIKSQDNPETVVIMPSKWFNVDNEVTKYSDDAFYIENAIKL